MKPIHIIQVVIRSIDYDNDKWYDICIERLPKEKTIIFQYYSTLFRDIGSDFGTHKNLFLSEYTETDGNLTKEDIRLIRDFRITNFHEGIVLCEEHVPRIITDRYMIIEL
jgi:hypothetical protein